MVDFGDSIPGKFSASNETYARSTIILIMWHMYRDWHCRLSVPPRPSTFVSPHICCACRNSGCLFRTRSPILELCEAKSVYVRTLRCCAVR